MNRPPPPPAPTPIPDLNDPAVVAEQQRILQAAAQRSGRASTILTATPAGTGANYSGTTTGTP